jgi:hypothetical protein
MGEGERERERERERDRWKGPDLTGFPVLYPAPHFSELADKISNTWTRPTY